MRLIFITEARFIKDAKGNIYGDASYNQDLWERYLNAFTEIFVVARVITVDDYTGDLRCISSMRRVTFVELPYFIGLKQYFLAKRHLQKKIGQLVNELKEAYFICRIPGTIGSLVIAELNKLHKPFAVEVVGDPWDVFAPGGVSHFLRRFIRIKTTLELKHNVKNANAVLYVTKNTLQKRYPATNAKFSTFASNVKLEEENVSKSPKFFEKKDIHHIISVGSLAQMYKSPDVVLKAVKQLHNEGISCFLTWLGGGTFLEPMKSLAGELKIAHLVNFKGDVNKGEVQKVLSKSDLFVLASKTEGLPRAVIEAMAAGLPCIGSKVGGIPELLDEKVLVPKGDVEKLAEKIKELLTNEDFYNQQAARNLEEAKNYTETILSERRNQFYNYIVNNL